MAWISIMPGDETTFRRQGWNAPAAFLQWTGILVNRHRQRQVEWVSLAEDGEAASSFYLKKQSSVSWRERLRNAWHGFGWTATAVREALLLQELRQAGIGCADVIAYGEDQRQAFALLRDEAGMVELRSYLQSLTKEDERQALATALGVAVARIHDAGFDHPDLYAKHVLVAPEGAGYRFCVLDWQRSRRHGVVSWETRCRDLAGLDATLHDALASPAIRLGFLQAYCSANRNPPPLFGLARRIQQLATRLRRKRNILEIGQLPIPEKEQRFVPCLDSQLWLVQSFHEELGGSLPHWLADLCESDDSWHGEADESSPTTLLLHSWPATGAVSPLDLPLAHTLFRLHRFGVAAPRLLAAGRSTARAFIVTTRPAAYDPTLLEADLVGARTAYLHFCEGDERQPVLTAQDLSGMTTMLRARKRQAVS